MPAVFEMVVLIVFIVFGAGVLNNYLKSRVGGKQLEAIEKELESRLATIDKLEKRIQVLEKIVTDRHYDAKRELDELDRESRRA